MKVKAPYGTGELSIDIPDKNLLGVILPPDVPVKETEPAIREALAQPIGTRRLREMETSQVKNSDHTH